VSRGSSACPPVLADASDPDPARAAAVGFADDELLGQRRQDGVSISGVRGAKRRVCEPLRAPWVEMKYSSTDNPSRKEDLIGRGIISPRGLDTSPFMRRSGGLAAGCPCTGVHHHVERNEGDRGQRLLHRPADLGVRRSPDLDLLLAALVIGDDPSAELVLGLLRLLS